MGASFYGALADLYDEVVVDPVFSQWTQFLDDRWARPPHPVTRVLDVGCGTGLLAAELVALGYDVVGIDGSQPMLDRARLRLGTHVPLERSVLPTLPHLGTFDAAVSTFDTLNYLTPRDFALTLRGLARVLHPGGWLVFDLHTPELLEVIASEPHSRGEESGWSYVLDSTVDRAEATCRTRFVAHQLESGATVEETHEQHVFSDDEVHTRLDEAGFEVVEVVDEYTDAARSERTLRATWVARRRSGRPAA
jgi:SAM-dependent methyltransferase